MTFVPASLRNRPLAKAVLGATLAAGCFPFMAHADEAGDDQSGIIVNGLREDGSNPNANPTAPFKVERSANDKFTEALRDTPKTVIAIPKEVIEDIGATSFREVVRSTPGVTLGTGEGGNAFGDRIFIRGFEARNDVYIDGLRDPGVTSREIFAVEQIEVVKGPSGSFGGRGTTGGLVSLESKRPQMGRSFAIVEGGVGTENFYRTTVDANMALGQKLAIRVNGLYHNADTPGRDYVNTERYGGSIAATFAATDTLTLSADYYVFRLTGIPDYGHPFDVVTQRPYQVDGDNFYGVIGRDFIENGADVGTARIDFQPIDALKFRSVTRYGKTYNHYLVASPGSVCRLARTSAGACPAGGTSATVVNPVPESQYTITVGAQRRWSDNEYIANVTDVTARFDTGGIGHTLVFGGEFARETVDLLPLSIPASVEDASGNIVSTAAPFVRNLFNPDPVLGYNIPVTADRTNPPTKTTVQSLSAYAIDTIKFGSKLNITLGARYDSYDLSYYNPTATVKNLANKVDFWNWQASIVYKPVEAMSLYASYATSSNPSGEQIDGNGISYDGIAVQTQNLSPERNVSYEAGAKYELFNGEMLLTAAAFQITKNNAREQVVGGTYELVGELRSRGLEAGVSGNLGKKVQLFGSYTYTDAKIIQSQNSANVGRRFANIPQHSASLLATYALTSRVQVGGQVHYQSKLFGGTQVAGTAHIPGYTRFDAVARWRPTDQAELRLNVLNLTDKRYYDAIYRSGAPFAYIAPGRSATLTGTYRF